MIDEMKGEPVYQFCNRTNTVVDETGLTFLALFSGGVPTVFVFTPPHIKQLLTTLTEKVGILEKKLGPIDGRRPKDRPVKSPIDLSKPADEEGM